MVGRVWPMDYSLPEPCSGHAHLSLCRSRVPCWLPSSSGGTGIHLLAGLLSGYWETAFSVLNKNSSDRASLTGIPRCLGGHPWGPAHSHLPSARRSPLETTATLTRSSSMRRRVSPTVTRTSSTPWTKQHSLASPS